MKSVCTIALLALATYRSLAQDAVQQQQQLHHIRALQRTCRENDDCNDKQFCSEGLCRDHGTCNTLVDCMNPANTYPMIECMGYLKCEDGKCGRECSDSPCPDNRPSVRCLAQPCEATKCDEPYDVCVDDYCGGCNAIFFNAEGSRVCSKESEPSSVCSNDKDCDTDNTYCANGKCLEHGTCETAQDCENPSNTFIGIKCEGRATCEKGICGKRCAESPCPDGKLVQCFAEPCSVTKCDEPFVSCKNDYCGGCNAIFINEAGKQVCTVEESSLKACKANTDCNADEEYCAQGTCRPHGFCSTVRDCQNPSNQYNVIFCMGYLTCENNVCGVECSGSSCANGTATSCLASPCNVTKCGERYETCVDDYCGGCNAIFFNATGDQVCLPEKTNNSTCNESCRGQRTTMKMLVCMMNKMIGRTPCSGSRK